MSYNIDAVTEDCYTGTTCLINKFGITDESQLKEIEASITMSTSAQLEKAPLPSEFNTEYTSQFISFYFKIYTTGRAHSGKSTFLRKEQLSLK